MSRMGDTKEQIIRMLGDRNKTLTDISEALDLAPSTVSQHLRELVDSGQIRQVGDRPRKWKYYELNRGYPQSPSHPGFQVRRIVMPIAGIILMAVVVLAAGLYLSGGGIASAQQVYVAPGSAVPQGSTVFTLSDSPQFYNISALFVTVTNASVRGASGKWYRIPLQERTFNLVQLRNISEILSGVNLSGGSYDAIALSASNVSAIVNGTSRPVFLPSGRIMVVGRFNISGNSTNWVNIDFDLGRSLHMTGNGTLVMMPVLVVSRRTSNDIGLNSSSIITAGFTPQEHEVFNFGMDMNGSMRDGFCASQNMSIGIKTGRPFGMGVSQPMLMLRTGRGFIVGSNAGNFLRDNMMNGTGSWNGIGGGNAAAGRGSWVRLPPGLAGGNAGGYADCAFRDGAIGCDQNYSANAIVPIVRERS